MSWKGKMEEMRRLFRRDFFSFSFFFFFLKIKEDKRIWAGEVYLISSHGHKNFNSSLVIYASNRARSMYLNSGRYFVRACVYSIV